MSQVEYATGEVPSCDGPFPVAPRRTKRDRFRITSLSSSRSCRLWATREMQCHSGSPHLAYRMATASRPPVPLRPVDDLLVLPGRSLLLRLLWALRSREARAW